MVILVICMMLLPAIADIRHRSFWIVPPVIMTVLILILQLVRYIHGSYDAGSSEMMGNLYQAAAREAVSRIAATIPGILFVILSRAGKAGIGAGDGLMLILLGILTGFLVTISTCIISLVMTAAVGSVIALVKGTGGKTSLPYIPFLVAGYLVQYIFS